MSDQKPNTPEKTLEMEILRLSKEMDLIEQALKDHEYLGPPVKEVREPLEKEYSRLNTKINRLKEQERQEMRKQAEESRALRKHRGDPTAEEAGAFSVTSLSGGRKRRKITVSKKQE